MEMNSNSLNFIAEPTKFGTIFFPKKENPICVLTGANLKKRESEFDLNTMVIKYNFSSFKFPSLNSLFSDKVGEKNIDTEIFEENTLLISVDNSFDIPTEKAVSCIFIDHHLFEQITGSSRYHSNAIMIHKNFVLIAKFLEKIIREKEIQNIGVLFHTDLDGVGSGLLIAKILELIKYNRVKEISVEDIDSVSLATVLGEYGDISEDKEELLFEVFQQKDIYSAGLKKKFEIMTKNLGRYLKAIRPVIELEVHDEEYSETDRSNMVNKYDELIPKYRIGYREMLKSYYKIKNYFDNLQNIDSLEIISFISSLVQDQTNRIIIELVQKEIDALVDSYLRPSTPQIDIVVQFTNIEKSPEYKLLLIDSPLDVGRSVMWTYRGRLQYFKDDPDYKRFSMANYRAGIPYILKKCKNICCYNIFSGKLSLQSEDESAFEIGKAFGGGGHGNTGAGSLGSVLIPINKLKQNCIITEMI